MAEWTITPPQAAPQQSWKVAPPAQAALQTDAPKKDWERLDILPLAKSPEGKWSLAWPNILREPVMSAVRSGKTLEQGQVPSVEEYMPALMAVTPGAPRVGKVAATVKPIAKPEPVTAPPAAPVTAAATVGKGVRAPKAAKPVEPVTPKPAEAAPASAAAPPPAKPPEPEPPPQGSPRGPGPILEPPPIGETTKQAVSRIDDGLYRMRKNATADKIEARQFLENIPKEIIDPRVQEQLYAAIERKMVDPKAEIPPELQPAWKVLQPIYDEQNATYARIKARSPETAEQLPDSTGYVHRVAKGKGSYFDKADPESFQGADPVLGTRSLSNYAPSLQARQNWVVQDASGQRKWLGKPPKGAEWAEGEKHESGGRLRLATSEEVEANTPVRYHKNATINTVDNLLRLKRVERNLDLLDQLKGELKQSGLGHQEKWTYRDEQNREVVGRNPNKAPEGFKATTLPQFNGWVLDPKIKAVLDDFHNVPGSDLGEALAKVNRFLTGSIFITPIPHIKNVAAHWFPSRSWEWIKPQGYRHLVADSGRAIKAVITQNDDYKNMLREGSGLLYGDVANQNFHKMMIEKLGNEMMADERGWAPIAREFGFSKVSDLVKTLYRVSSKALWAANDMFMLQRQFELQRKGLPVRKAIQEAERDIPNYRVPTEVMGSRMASQLLRNKNVFMFGNYRYGQFRAFAEVAKDLAKGSPDQKMDAAGKVFMLAALGMGVYPFANMALQSVTGNKNAEVTPAGPLSPIESTYGLVSGQKEWLQGVASIITPAPTIELAREIQTNKDVFGRDIVDPQASTLGKVVQGGEALAGTTYPGAMGLEMMKPGGTAQALGQLGGLKIPPRPPYKPGAQRFRQAARREGQDPIEQAVKKGWSILRPGAAK